MYLCLSAFENSYCVFGLKIHFKIFFYSNIFHFFRLYQTNNEDIYLFFVYYVFLSPPHNGFRLESTYEGVYFVDMFYRCSSFNVIFFL